MLLPLQLQSKLVVAAKGRREPERNGDVTARRNVAVHLLTEDRSAVVTSWRFLDARPSAWHVANFDALHPVTLIERLELVVQRMEVE